MADLRVEDIRTSEEFNQALWQQGVIMPINHHPSEVGEVVDAIGQKVFQVDPDGMMPDARAQSIAAMIILAVNTCGSFLAVQAGESIDG